MSSDTEQPARLPFLSNRAHEPRDLAFRIVTIGASVLIVVAMALILWGLVEGSLPSIREFGLQFIWSSRWSNNEQEFGALIYLSGTALTSALALLLSVPVSLGIAVLLTQYLPGRVRDLMVFVVELLAAIPSVVYGLWGMAVAGPILVRDIAPVLEATPLGALPFFGEPNTVASMFVAGVVLAIMITPIITSFSREVMMQVPSAQRDAGIALGLTRWEVVRGVVIPYARAGIFSATILGLGRAIGETMAVTMLIGNTRNLTVDFFEPAYTMSSLLANEFNQSTGALRQAALFEVGLVLFALAFVVNAFARIIFRRLAHEGTKIGGNV